MSKCRDSTAWPGSAVHAMEDATRQVELFMMEFPVLYPNERVFRIAP